MSGERSRYSSGAPWEDSVGFSRALRCGTQVFSAGTLASDEHGVIHGADSYDQCCYIFRKLERALQALGAELKDVVKVVCYLVDMDDAPGFSRAHLEFLGDVRPATTCVIVKALFSPEARAEIEVLAIVAD
jgi:enamine deaminase RidA (YjgF/YER057c/UK114 family)